jgi:hypothetical protein
MAVRLVFVTLENLWHLVLHLTYYVLFRSNGQTSLALLWLLPNL